MQINYAVSNTFAQIHRDNEKYIFVMGPVGSGKTSGCIWHCLLNACKQVPDENGVRHSKYAVVRATYPSLKSTTLKSWIGWFKDKIRITYDIPIRASIKYDLDDGTKLDMEILFIAVDTEQNVEKLRSLEITGCHINECSEVDYAVFEMLKTRVNRYPAKKDGGAVDPFIICDYNAVATDHWLYKLAEEIRPEGHSFYKQPPAVMLIGGKYVVNPEAENLEHLDDNYYQNICLGGDPDFIYVNLMNNYGEVRKGKPVYKEYDDVGHSTIGLGPVSGVPLVVGMDQGLRPAAVFTQQLPDGSVRVFDEIVTEDCSLQEFCEDLFWPLMNSKYKEFKKNYYVVVDPMVKARSQNDKKEGSDILKECGVKFQTARTNLFTPRREAVVHFLRLKDKFKIDSMKCSLLRKGFISEYKYDELRSVQSGEFKERPTKNIYSNVHDALQYACLEYYNPNKKKRPVVRKTTYKPGSDIGGY